MRMKIDVRAIRRLRSQHSRRTAETHCICDKIEDRKMQGIYDIEQVFDPFSASAVVL